MRIIDLVEVLEFNAPLIIKRAFSCKVLFDGLTTELYERVDFADLLDYKVALVAARDTTVIITV